VKGSVLDDIVAHKRTEAAARRRAVPLAELEASLRDAPVRRPFTEALRARIAAGGDAVIAEIKKASPSRGVIREPFEPVEIARQYEAAGAAALSILTDERYFQGHDQYLRDGRAAVALPVLRKDFIVDAYQVYETRALGADCLLLIVAALRAAELVELYEQAREVDLDVLIEVHDEIELDLALGLDPPLIGINNRNLKTFETRLDTTFELLRRLPPSDDRVIVTESGIHTREDVAAMHQAGVHAFLVGEAFMRAPRPGDALRALFGAPEREPESGTDAG
jgi:indole-3-glycerol phosphate synthase